MNILRGKVVGEGIGYPVNNKELLLVSYLHWLNNLKELLFVYKCKVDTYIPEIDISPDGCALCYHYRILIPGEIESYHCSQCPIRLQSGRDNCRDTPYKSVSNRYGVMCALNAWCIKDSVKVLIVKVWEECLYLKRLYHKGEDDGKGKEK